jgi:hypothetical protein
MHLGTHPGGNGLSGLEVNGIIEQDMFVIGDDDDMDIGTTLKSVDEPPPYTSSEPEAQQIETELESSPEGGQPEEEPCASQPSRYYIKPGDTLAGISLRLGIDVSSFS